MTPRARWLRFCLGCALLPQAVAAAAEEPNLERTLSPYFFVQSEDPEVDRLPLLSTAVNARIAGVIADVTVTQTYKNDGSRPIEAIYVFPASTRAAVYAMKMTLEDREIVAEIRERQQARAEYERAKQEGKSASLLEQQRPNVFQMNVANILPGDTIAVEMSYTELLVPTDGVYEFVYPTVVGPRYSNVTASQVPASEHWVASPYQHSGEAPLSTFGMHVDLAAGLPIQEVLCPSHKTTTAFDGATAASVDLDPEEQAGGNRDFILRYRLAGGQIETGLLLSEGEEESFFLLMVQPPRAVAASEIPPREYIFIMDVSGSMSGYPIETSKKLLRDLLVNLRPVDSFNVLFFSGGSWLLSEESLPATPENVEQALQRVGGQSGGGGTELVPALKQALALPRAEDTSRTIVIATDGYVGVEPEAFDVVRDNLGDANLFAFGIGGSVNRFLIEGLAHVGMGEPFVVTKPDEAPALAERFRKYVETPLLSRVRLGFDAFETYDVEPKAVPDLLASRPLLVFGKWRGEARGAITVTGRAANGGYRRTIDVAQAKPSPWASALRYLWARHRIQLLADYIGAAPSEEKVKEVTRLGLEYNLLTAYTSFVAVDHVVRNREGAPERVDQPLPMPQGVSDRALPAASGVVGAVCETVTVSTAQPLGLYGAVTSASAASMSVQVEESSTARDLPLRDGRDFVGLEALVPGAARRAERSATAPGPAAEAEVRLNGQSQSAASFVFDGIDGAWGTRGLPPSLPILEAIAEVKIETAGFSAQQGGTAGALTQVSLRAGTGTVHGSALLFGTGPGLRASDYFSHLRPGGDALQGGASLGGPAVRDKLFFFAAYQHTRDDWGGVEHVALPMEGFRGGDFSAAPTVIYDPATGNADGSGRQPFPQNRIPGDRISPTARRILELLPSPNRLDAALGQVNYESTFARQARAHTLDTRVDWIVSPAQRLSARLGLSRTTVDRAGTYGAYGGPGDAGWAGRLKGLALVAGLTYEYAPSPTVALEAHLGLTHSDRDAEAPATAAGAASFGIPGAGPGSGLPSIDVAGYSAPLVGVSSAFPGESSWRVLQANAKLTKVWGTHNTFVGLDLRLGRERLLASEGAAGPRGLYHFDALQTASPADPASQAGLANAFASFLLDAPDSVERSLPLQAVGTRRSETALFVQDEWRLTPRLTANFGLRWQWRSAPRGLEERGGLVAYDPETNALRIAGYGDIPANLGVEAGSGHLLPRLNVTYELVRNTVVTGSYGLHLLPFDSSRYASAFPLIENDQLVKPGTYQAAGRLADGLPAVRVPEIPASGILPATSAALLAQEYVVVPPELLSARLHTWGFGVRRSLPWRLEAAVFVVGNRGFGVPALTDLNAGMRLGADDAGRPQRAAFGRSASTLAWRTGKSDYRALQASLSRVWRPLTLMAAYTWGRSRDFASEGAQLSTPADPERSWGRSDFDRTHVFAAAFVFRPLEWQRGWRGALLGGWRLAGVIQIQSGTPVDVTMSAAALGAPGNAQRPDLVSRPSTLGATGPEQVYFDETAFSRPAAAAWGSLTRNAALSGPTYVNLDLSLAKQIHLGGRSSLDLILDAFNATNSPHFLNPSGLFGSATFGQVTRTVPGSERTLRLGARFQF